LAVERPQKPEAKRRSGASLTGYRLYFLEGDGRHIEFSHEFEAEDDARAIKIAEGWRERRGAELWSGSRKVKAWSATS
jgi:hypothetical protein